MVSVHYPFENILIIHSFLVINQETLLVADNIETGSQYLWIVLNQPSVEKLELLVSAQRLNIFEYMQLAHEILLLKKKVAEYSNQPYRVHFYISTIRKRVVCSSIDFETFTSTNPAESANSFSLTLNSDSVNDKEVYKMLWALIIDHGNPQNNYRSKKVLKISNEHKRKLSEKLQEFPGKIIRRN